MAKKNIYGESPATVKKRSRKKAATKSAKRRAAGTRPEDLVGGASIAMQVGKMKDPEMRGKSLTRKTVKKLSPSRQKTPPQRGPSSQY